MKKILLLLVVVQSAFTLAQSEIIIDKSENTASIFDYGDPFSLVSLLKFNWITEMEPMSDETVDELKAAGFTDELYVFEKAAPEPKQYYYDVDEISRIVLHVDTVENEATGERYSGIKDISFARQYGKGDKYYTVMTIPFRYLTDMDAFKVFVKVPPHISNQLLDQENSKSLISVLRKEHLHWRQEGIAIAKYELRKKDIDSEFFPIGPPLMQDGLSRYRRPTDACGNKIPMYPGNSLATCHSFNLNLDYTLNQQTTDSVLNYYSVIDTTFFWDTPLINNDPNSPEYGMPLKDTLDDGQIVTVYPQDRVIYWVNEQPDDVYLMLNFQRALNEECKQKTMQPENLFFTDDHPDIQNPVLLMRVGLHEPDKLRERTESDEFLTYLDSFPSYSELKWLEIIVNKLVE